MFTSTWCSKTSLNMRLLRKADVLQDLTRFCSTGTTLPFWCLEVPQIQNKKRGFASWLLLFCMDSDCFKPWFLFTVDYNAHDFRNSTTSNSSFCKNYVLTMIIILHYLLSFGLKIIINL